jgi:hypothetical protein
MNSKWRRGRNPSYHRLLGKCLKDQAAGDHEERLVDVVAALPLDPKASVLMQPGDGPLDHPALASQAGAVRTLRGGATLLRLIADDLRPFGRRCGGAGLPATTGYLRGFPVRDMRGITKKPGSVAPGQTTRYADMQDFQRGITGATGLEPATSGVTGRVGHHDAPRRTSSKRVICRAI